MTFPQTEESLRNLYRFVVFYRQIICILNAVFSMEEKYYPNSDIESDYLWLVAKVEKIVKHEDFSKFTLENEFDRAKRSFVSERGILYSIGKQYEKYIYTPFIPLKKLDILKDKLSVEKRRKIGILN